MQLDKLSQKLRRRPINEYDELGSSGYYGVHNYGEGLINISMEHEPGYRTGYGFNKPSFGKDTAIIEKFSINDGEEES